MIVYQINVLLFHPYRSMVREKRNSYKLQNPYRSVVLLGHNFVEIICWFTTTAIYFTGKTDSVIKTLMETTVRIFTFNYENPDNLTKMEYLLFTEVVCGIVLVMISIAKFLGELPHADLEFEGPVRKKYVCCGRRCRKGRKCYRR